MFFPGQKNIGTSKRRDGRIAIMSDPGYWISDALLSRRECEALIEVLSRPTARRGRAGARHLMATPEIGAFASDPRLLRIAQETLGPSAVAYRATLFEKSGRANWLVSWHQDTVLPLKWRVGSSEWGPWSTKQGVLYAQAPGWALGRILALRVHLDASTNENGPLRVIPGSHRAGVLGEAAVLNFARQHQPFECPAPRGGVIAMRPLLIHSSSKARAGEPRRVLHIEYAESMHLGGDIHLALA